MVFTSHSASCLEKALVFYDCPVFCLKNIYTVVSLTIYRLLLRSAVQLCNLQKFKISLREFFVYKNATSVDYYEAMLRFFYYFFLQVSLFVDVYKKQATQKNFKATQLWVMTNRLRTMGLADSTIKKFSCFVFRIQKSCAILAQKYYLSNYWQAYGSVQCNTSSVFSSINYRLQGKHWKSSQNVKSFFGGQIAERWESQDFGCKFCTSWSVCAIHFHLHDTRNKGFVGAKIQHSVFKLSKLVSTKWVRDITNQKLNANKRKGLGEPINAQNMHFWSFFFQI